MHFQNIELCNVMVFFMCNMYCKEKQHVTTHMMTFCIFLYSCRSITWNNMVGTSTVGRSSSFFNIQVLFIWFWGLPPKPAYHSHQTMKTVTHAFVSAHVYYSYHSLHLPLSLLFSLLLSQALREQTSRDPPISAVSLCPLWTILFPLSTSFNEKRLPYCSLVRDTEI